MHVGACHAAGLICRAAGRVTLILYGGRTVSRLVAAGHRGMRQADQHLLNRRTDDTDDLQHMLTRGCVYHSP